MSVVTAAFSVAGNIESFNREAFVAGLRALLPAARGINVGTSAASVSIVAYIVMGSESDGDVAIFVLTSTKPNVLSGQLGVTLTGAPTAVAATELVAAPSPPLPPRAPPLAPSCPGQCGRCC